MAEPVNASNTPFATVVEACGQTIDPNKHIWSVTIESGLGLSDSCEIMLTREGTQHHADRLANAERGALTVLLAHLGDELDVAFIGEITETHAANRHGRTLVCGLNAGIGLRLGHSSYTYTKGTEGVTLKDIVEAILQRHPELKLSADFGDEPPTIKHMHVYQAGEDDFSFIVRLAEEEGYNVLVRDQKLLVQRWTKKDSGIKLKLRSSDAPRMIGDDKNVIGLWSFVAERNEDGQVVEVRLRCWQPDKRTHLSVVCTSDSGSGRTGAAATSPKYKKTAVHFSDVHFTSPEEGKQKGNAILERMRRSYLTATASCAGDPRLKPGMLVDLSDVDPDYCGKWHITAVRHRYDHEGQETFKTEFQMCRSALQD